MDLDPVAFSAALMRCESTADCAVLFKRAIKPYGLDTFASGEVDIGDRDLTVFAVLDWPDAIKQLYFKEGLFEKDPIMETLGRRSGPFTWEDMRADKALGKAGTRSLKILADYGYVAGLVVPFFHGNDRYGLVSLAGQKGDLSKRDYDLLTLVSTSLYYRARFLAPRVGFAVPPLGLSTRQIECLQLVANGLSDREIGLILKISVTTAHEYVEVSKNKLKAKTRGQAVARGISFGIIF